MTSLTDSNLKATLKKLPLQFAHASADKLFQLIKDSARRRPLDSRVKKFLEQICKDCETCIGFTKTKPKPVVGFSLARSFNEVIALDLHELDKSTYYLHIIDVFTRYSSGAIITYKSADVIIKVFLERWVSIFGHPRVGVYTDNGGEFNNEKFREMGELFNFTDETTAGYSPWSNGVVERGNAVLTNMLQNLHADQRLLFGVALPWALMAKNSLSNTSGFNHFQLVFGQNPKMPSVLVNEQPALKPKSKCDYLEKHIYALQIARQNFIAAESSEKISRALRAQTRQTDEQFSSGKSVFYKRGDDWKGPGIVMGQDGVVVIIRHGGAVVRAHSMRVLRRQNEDESISTPQKQSVGENSRPLALEDQEEAVSASKVAVTSQEDPNTISCKPEEASVGEPQNTTDDQPPVSSTVMTTKGTKIGSNVSFELDGQRFSGTVVSRAGKAGGKQRSWRNVRLDIPNTPETAINAFELEKVDNLRVIEPE